MTKRINVVEMDEVDVHRGSTLLHFARTYNTVSRMLVESVQNALDAEADRILLMIDFSGPNRRLCIVDNGVGVNRERFKEALVSVSLGIKDKDVRVIKDAKERERKKKLGKFGLGLVSPLDKCTTFTFYSAPIEGQEINAWTFRGADLKIQHRAAGIPHVYLPKFPSLPRKFLDYAAGEFASRWRSMSVMEGVTKDRVTSLVDVDELGQEIEGKLGLGMLQNKAMVRIVLIDSESRHVSLDITPAQFSGEPLDTVVYEGEEAADAGRVEIELYRALKIGGKRKGNVYVMASSDMSRVSIHDFAAQAWGRRSLDLLGNAMQVLKSGYFEGVIRCDNIALHPERKNFIPGDPLDALYLLIDRWYEEYGEQHFKLEQESARETRWQELGLKSQARISEQLRRPEFARLWEGYVSLIEQGRIGSVHIAPSKGRLDGPDVLPSVRVGQGGAGQTRTPSGEPSIPTERQHEPKDRPGDIPLGSLGPKGQKRRLVKGDSQGLMLGHQEMLGSTQLWELERETGTLWFNVRHPIWAKLDETKGKHLVKNAKQITHLMEWLALEVINLLVHYPHEEDFEQHRVTLDDKIRYYVELFIV